MWSYIIILKFEYEFKASFNLVVGTCFFSALKKKARFLFQGFFFIIHFTLSNHFYQSGKKSDKKSKFVKFFRALFCQFFQFLSSILSPFCHHFVKGLTLTRCKAETYFDSGKIGGGLRRSAPPPISAEISQSFSSFLSAIFRLFLTPAKHKKGHQKSSTRFARTVGKKP